MNSLHLDALYSYEKQILDNLLESCKNHVRICKNIPGRPSMDILVRSCQDLGKILAKILPRYCQNLQDVMVRFYQESHVPKKFFCKILFGQKRSERKSTKIYIYADLHR